MPKTDLTRRTITWSKATDEALQDFLGPKASNLDELSEFVEDSVRWRLFDRTVQAIKDRNASLDPDQIQDEIDQAVQEVRREMGTRKIPERGLLIRASNP